MSIFKTAALSWWQVGIIKISMIALGVILGVYFQAFFLKWIVIVTILFIVPAIYIARVWFRAPALVKPASDKSETSA